MPWRFLSFPKRRPECSASFARLFPRPRSRCFAAWPQGCFAPRGVSPLADCAIRHEMSVGSTCNIAGCVRLVCPVFLHFAIGIVCICVDTHKLPHPSGHPPSRASSNSERVCNHPHKLPGSMTQHGRAEGKASARLPAV